MRRIMIVAVAVGVVLATGVCHAQNDGPPAMPEKVRNFLGKCIGTWTWVSGNVSGDVVCEWDPGENYGIAEFSATVGGKRLFLTGLIGWDGASEDGIVILRNGPATYDVGHLEVVSDTVMEGKVDGVFFGRKSSGSVRFVIQGPDQYTVFATSETDSGESREMKTVYTRVNPDMSQPNPEMKQELLAVDKTYWEACVDGDAEALDGILADAFVGIYDDGGDAGIAVWTKGHFIDMAKSKQWILRAWKYDHVKVYLRGKTAAIHGLVTTKEELGGKDTSGRFRFASTWIKESSGWMCTGENYARVSLGSMEQNTVDIQKLSPEMKKLEVFVGDWTYEGEQVDPPMDGLPFGEGGNFSGKFTTRFVLDGSFQQANWSDDSPDTAHGISMISYDAKEKHYVEYGFMNEGSWSVRTSTLQGHIWTSNSTMTTRKGDKVPARTVEEYSSDWSSYTATAEVSPDNGKTWKLWWKERGKKVEE